ncbi:nuclear transport factor 2 family protein [Streptacidiphilus fuscans]|uniref:Nuclear transport factor 2 family protein n=1 Tax=Streptacidiphilus fuscans TaxID=2789292 RepID=A0A931B7S0_9ACTN|nr:nuclear transport factor 2 family protein [Streptacidiphilus fuscans]MBF9072775.1 nuclear transport factor 2 family protein [Streptacidiphilus fuscans]
MNTHTRTTVLPDVVAAYIDAVNAFDVDAVMATFADTAVVNDAHHEFADPAAIRAWVSREIVGDKVTMDVTEVVSRPGLTILRARYDGAYDKTNLPDELVLTNYVTVADDGITSLIIVHNQPSPY